LECVWFLSAAPFFSERNYWVSSTLIPAKSEKF
jgi:hypothetical protein